MGSSAFGISALKLGETSVTAYRGDRGAVSYAHSQTTGNPHATVKEEIAGLTILDIPQFEGFLATDFSKIKGVTSGYRDMHGQIGIKGSGSQDPTWTTFRDGIKGYAFSATQLNEVIIEFHPDHDYSVPDGYYPHLHISTASTSPSGTVRFGFEYTSAKGYEQGVNSDFPTTVTIFIEYTFIANSQYRHIILESPTPINDVNTEIDSLILCRVFRDAANANDTFTGTIFLFRCDLHYKTARISTPNKNFPFG